MTERRGPSFAYSTPVPPFPSQTSPPHIGSLAILRQRRVSGYSTTERFSLRTQLRLLTLPIASVPRVPRGDPPDSKSGLPPTRDVSSSARSSAVNSYAFSLCAPAYFAFLFGLRCKERLFQRKAGMPTRGANIGNLYKQIPSGDDLFGIPGERPVPGLPGSL